MRPGMSAIALFSLVVSPVAARRSPTGASASRNEIQSVSNATEPLLPPLCRGCASAEAYPRNSTCVGDAPQRRSEGGRHFEQQLRHRVVALILGAILLHKSVQRRCARRVLTFLVLRAAMPTDATISVNFEVTLTPGTWTPWSVAAVEITWDIDGGTVYPWPAGDGTYPAYTQTVALAPGTHDVYLYDSWGDGWNDATLELREEGGGAVVAGPWTLAASSCSVGSSCTGVGS
eukprot:CAMPEP_0196694326 /NCGR_PEP_ID=MMETSP1090-20130531/33392_1 /TAXON_ID=37098 /ORGANISM="Isochrysis sp, Strain CCMP1244" /LENGTH=231 /DNA_ID=CAMNT_0042033811 /DNA_START=1 /DNA_END=692 /DNA_ORIENTATION=+